MLSSWLWQWHVHGWCCWYCSLRCVSFYCRHCRFEPEGHVRSWLVLLVTLHSALCFFPCRQAQDARHGQYAPEGMLRVAVQKTADFPQLQFFRSLIFLSCSDRCPYCTGRFCRGAEAVSHGPDLFWIIVFPQLLDMVIDAPGCTSCADFSCRGADADSHGADCSSGHGVSLVCLRQDDRCTCCARSCRFLSSSASLS